MSPSLYLDMFGYDDDELNDQCMRCANDATITTVITLDKSQAGGVHEKTILASDVATGFGSVQRALRDRAVRDEPDQGHQGGVLDGKVGFEGSTNWSTSGEGTFVVTGHPGGVGYKAQNNTLAVFTDPDAIARFTAELIAEHLVAVDQGGRLGATKTRSKPASQHRHVAASCGASRT